MYVHNGSPITATCLAMRKLTTWKKKTVRHWNNWRKAAHMKKARPTSKQRFKNAGRNPTRTITPKTQSDVYQGKSKLQYSDYAQGTTGCDTMLNKFKIGENDLCACGLAPQNTEHVLFLSDLRTGIWPTNGTHNGPKIVGDQTGADLYHRLHRSIGSHDLTTNLQEEQRRE